MFDLKYRRGDPDLPFQSDPAEAAGLMARFVSPTHEPLWFLRNRGTCSKLDEERNERFRSAENVEVMERLGMHMPKRTFFFKGLGIERERPYFDQTVAYAKELHARNMLVSVYFGGTLFTDYFFKEVPEAVDWRRVDMDGLPVTYGGYQVQRWFPCLNNPGYREYARKVLAIATDEVEADEIFFDNQILRYEPRSCRCAHCIAHLRGMVRRRYTLDQCERRYGAREYPDVQPPVYSQAAKPWRHDQIKIPQIQDWIDHRVATVIEFYEDMSGFVKSRKPDCAVGMNVKGIHGHNRAFDHGISHGGFAGILDFTCIDGYSPGRKAGARTFWSEVRLYKQSHSTGISVVDGGMADLQSVESVVLNKRKKYPGGWIGDDPWCHTPIGRFLAANKKLFHEREHLHDIAVLRSEPSTNYNNARVHEQLFQYEQTLIVEKLPWGIIFDGNIGQLDRYRIIALPEIQCLSDRWLEALDAFMRNGGGVIASGAAAAYDEWYRPRDPAHAFDRWLGGTLAARGGLREAPTGGRYASADVGRGRFVYVPGWEVETKWNFDDWFAIYGGNNFPVRDRELFLRAIRDAVPQHAPTPAHHVSGNDFVLAEAIAHADGGDRGFDLHFINHDPANTAPVMRVSVGLPQGMTSAEVTATDPADETDGFPARGLSSTVAAHPDYAGRLHAEFFFPTPRTYAFASIRFG